MEGGAWCRAVVLAGVAFAAVALVAAPPAFGAEDKRQATQTPPVFPTIDIEKDPDDSLEELALGVVRSGNTEWRAFRGKYRDFVEQDDFLVAVGRRDLADEIRTSRRNRNILSYGGRAVALTGLVLLIANASPGGFQPAPLLGFSLVAAGLASWIASGFMNGVSVTPDQAEGFATHYNQGLREHIDQAQRTRTKPGTFTLRWDVPVIRPVIGPSQVGGSAGVGAGLLMTLRF